jgi:hypothetical protein
MTHVASILAGTAALLAAALPAVAGEKAGAPAHAVIVDPAGVRMDWTMAMPSVKGGVSGATFQGTMPSMAMGMMMPGNARLILRPLDDTGQPVTAPTGFEVTAGGAVRDAEARQASLVVGGSLPGSSAASIELGRGLTLTHTGPGPAAAAPLVIVVQYN